MKKVTRGQALELSSRFQLDTNWDELDGDRAQMLIELSKEELGERFTAFLKSGVQVEDNLLLFIGHDTLSGRSDFFDPGECFNVGERLCIWDNYMDRILSTAQASESVSELTIISWALRQSATDVQIRAELSDSHVFEDAGVFCSHLAEMIEGQRSGTSELLLVNGGANIFYVRGSDEVFEVVVSWYGARQRWNVYAYVLGGYPRNAGSRVFSPCC